MWPEDKFSEKFQKQYISKIHTILFLISFSLGNFKKFCQIEKELEVKFQIRSILAQNLAKNVFRKISNIHTTLLFNLGKY